MPTDLPATIAALNANPDAEAATDAYLDRVIDAYWKEKDIQAVIALAQAGLAYSLSRPGQHKAASAIAYNLASFCWPGWNEPGITLTEKEIAIGRQASQQHAEIAATFQTDPIKKSRTAWILGAHHLAARNFAQAIAEFTCAAELAQQANNEPEQLLAHGYLLLTQSVSSPNTAAKSELDQLKSKLKPMKDGEFFITQLTTAESVFRL